MCCTQLTKNLMQIQVNAADVIIVEGILVFHDACVRGLMNMKIFVDTGLSVVDISPLFICFVVVYRSPIINCLGMITCNPQ